MDRGEGELGPGTSGGESWASGVMSQCLVFPGSGPIQLWQFLLELLTDKSCQSFISWTGDGWEFKLSDPDEVRREGAESAVPERTLGEAV